MEAQNQNFELKFWIKYLHLEVIDVEVTHESIRNLNIIEQWKESEISGFHGHYK